MQAQNMFLFYFWTYLTTTLGAAANFTAKIPFIVESLCIVLGGKALHMHWSLSSKMYIMLLPWPTLEVFACVSGGWFHNTWWENFVFCTLQADFRCLRLQCFHSCCLLSCMLQVMDHRAQTGFSQVRNKENLFQALKMKVLVWVTECYQSLHLTGAMNERAG